MKRNQIFLIVIIIVVILLLVEGYILFFASEENNFAKSAKQFFDEVIYSENNGQSNSGGQEGEQGPSSTSQLSGQGGGSAGGGLSEQENPSCLYQQIPYAIGNLKKIETCLEEQNEICINKEVFCEIDVINLDYEIAGIFTIQFLFFEQGQTQEQYFDSAIEELEIQPRQTKKFQSTISITNPDLAQKEIVCFYQTINIPKRKIC